MWMLRIIKNIIIIIMKWRKSEHSQRKRESERIHKLKIYFHKVLIAFSIFHVIHKAFSNQHQQINVFRLSKRQKVFFAAAAVTLLMLLAGCCYCCFLSNKSKKKNERNTFFFSPSRPISNVVVDRVKGICTFFVFIWKQKITQFTDTSTHSIRLLILCFFFGCCI